MDYFGCFFCYQCDYSKKQNNKDSKITKEGRCQKRKMNNSKNISSFL